ncbi:MAG: CoA-binding protein [Halobacteriota archaeon]|nr:CoA-binding protein [Halobacteriota archaeon]
MSEEKNDIFEAIFNPKSVAVVGASSNVRKGGHRRFVAILENYKGELYPVNPKEDEVAGKKAYSSVLDIPDDLDQVIISIPSGGVPEVMEECVKKGVKVVTVFTSGFSESGEEGKVLEREIVGIARKGDTRVVGPNCIGVYCPYSGLSFYPTLPKEEGDIAFISQSGGLAMAFVQTGTLYNLGYSRVISFGNAADLDCTDYFEYLIGDPKTEIVGAYLEGVKDGRRFTEVTRKLARKKPLIIWKVGRTEVGARAISSHTGSLAGEDHIWDGLFKQHGVVRAGSFDEVIDTVTLFKFAPSVGPRIAIITIGGGAGVATADICASMGLEIATFSSHTSEELKKVVPAAGTSVKNPVDLAATALNPSAMRRVMELVSEDESVDTIMTLGLPDATMSLFVRELKRFKGGKPLIVIAPISSESSIKAHKTISKGNIPVYSSEERAAKAISNVVWYNTKFGKYYEDGS